MKTIELIVAPDGSSRLETRGFAGEVCRDASRFLEEALGVRLSETLTPEFHAETVEQAREREQA
jgi:hypothetical protein